MDNQPSILDETTLFDDEQMSQDTQETAKLPQTVVLPTARSEGFQLLELQYVQITDKMRD